MATTRYQVTLSTDGKHQVSVTSDDEVATEAALSWASRIFVKLAKQARRKQEAVQPVAEEAPAEAPICAVHGAPMVWQKGRKGFFWSCHQKNADGSWCDWRPEREGNGA